MVAHSRPWWQQERGARQEARQEEDHTPGSSREPSHDPPAQLEEYKVPIHKDQKIQDGKRIRLSPRVTTEQFETIPLEELREYVRMVRAGFDMAQERAQKASEKVAVWKEQVKLEEQQRDVQKHNVKLFTQLLMEHDNDFSQKEQARKRDRSKDARSNAATWTRGRSHWTT